MMTPKHQVELLKMVWKTKNLNELHSVQAQSIGVVSVGEYDSARDMYLGAEVVIDRVVFRGDVLIWAGDESPMGNFESCILHITPYPCSYIFKQDGSALIQAVATLDPLLQAAYTSFKEGSSNYGCAGHVARMDGYDRVAMFTRLVVDRLKRKSGELYKIYEENDQSWSEAMYVLLFTTMGHSNNKEPFAELAKRVKYSAISRERNSLLHIEAMLLGASGLLNMYDNDSYSDDLKSNFEYLRRKYNIVPMMPRVWSISQNNPSNHPVIRIAQLAAFLATSEFLFNNIIKCRTVQELQLLFRAEASQYWSTHYIPGRRTDDRPKRIGHTKANLLGINLAVTLIFTYGDYLNDEQMKQEAIELLEKIVCESNYIVNAWRIGGVQMESAFDSQAVLQLNNEYCAKGLCWLCPVSRRYLLKIATQTLN